MSKEITIIENTNVEAIKHHIYEVRGLRVMLDRDLAGLYELIAEERDSMSPQFVMTSGREDSRAIVAQG